MNEYFSGQWSKEETNEITTEEIWLTMLENFTIPSSEVDSLYHDVYQFYMNVKEMLQKYWFDE